MWLQSTVFWFGEKFQKCRFRHRRDENRINAIYWFNDTFSCESFVCWTMPCIAYYLQRVLCYHQASKPRLMDCEQWTLIIVQSLQFSLLKIWFYEISFFQLNTMDHNPGKYWLQYNLFELGKDGTWIFV